MLTSTITRKEWENNNEIKTQAMKLFGTCLDKNARRIQKWMNETLKKILTLVDINKLFPCANSNLWLCIKTYRELNLTKIQTRDSQTFSIRTIIKRAELKKLRSNSRPFKDNWDQINQHVNRYIFKRRMSISRRRRYERV